ncbi:hypothetical protein P280DRAFT_465642 [Massarina eburnea CBS 473.64]|uniref:Protein BCP1 n=1 Tax=Massarina eburnea CBS 473.64 TaxID=1395130 RepID=A0A6A6SGT7_9PLEO|nr:hypothetical protein P280DRAFT_465642 [Massarina eburnea CBS 473.64]
MGKRKTPKDPEALPDAPEANSKRKNDDSESDDDMQDVDIDFEMFDPQPDYDFHGFKNLLRQLLGDDAQLFNLSELADLILAQPLVGTTVKVESNETDPYALLTVLNLTTHKDKPVIKDLIAYLARRSSSPSLSAIQSLLDPSASAEVGLIIAERLLNMPTALVPPMYNMLLEEIGWALEEKEPYAFTHYLILSKTYNEIESILPTADQPPSKKKKGGKGSGGNAEVFYFHPEDEVLQKHSAAWGNYDYESAADEGASDSKRVFQEVGIKPQGHLMLIEANKFAGAVDAVKAFINGQ